MENNNSKDQKIDDFIMGLLSKENQQKLEDQMDKDASFAEEVKLQQDVIEGIKIYSRKDFKSKLDVIEKEFVGKKPAKHKRRSLFPILVAAASILVLVFALYWVYDQGSQQTNQELYAAYFEPYDISNDQRTTSDEEIVKIKSLYKSGEYSEVLPLLERQITSPVNTPTYLLLAAGISHLELNQPSKALMYFNQISEKKDFNFEDKVQWYTALAYLKLEDPIASKKLLKDLANDPKADHYEDAKKLLKKIE